MASSALRRNKEAKEKKRMGEDENIEKSEVSTFINGYKSERKRFLQLLLFGLGCRIYLRKYHSH